MMENDKFNAAVVFREIINLYQEYDAIYDLNFTEDNFDIESCYFTAFLVAKSFYEQLSLLR